MVEKNNEEFDIKDLDNTKEGTFRVPVGIIIEGICFDVNYHDFNYKDVVETNNDDYFVIKKPYTYVDKWLSYAINNKESVLEVNGENFIKYTLNFINGKKIYKDERIKDNELERNELSPLECFRRMGSYMLIETEAEFEDYMRSNITAKDWSLIKLSKTMLELNLKHEFINGFADLIVDDLSKYKYMIELSKECENRDILMYLLVHKYGENK